MPGKIADAGHFCQVSGYQATGVNFADPAQTIRQPRNKIVWVRRGGGDERKGTVAAAAVRVRLQQFVVSKYASRRFVHSAPLCDCGQRNIDCLGWRSGVSPDLQNTAQYQVADYSKSGIGIRGFRPGRETLQNTKSPIIANNRLTWGGV